jgi:tetratricopeptide (TPR) repeat protein
MVLPGLSALPTWAATPARSGQSARTAPARKGIDDGNDGLAALERGDIDAAIRLFSLALLPGRLTPEDAEFAYFKRGEAHAAKEQFDLASDDFSAALKLNPSDTGARSALDNIPEKKAQAAFRAAMAPLPAGANPWGLYASMAGHCYWYQREKHDPHEAYARFVWLTPQTNLGIQLRSKTQQVIVGAYGMNRDNGLIIYSGLAGDRPLYSTVSVGVQMVADYSYENGTPTRELITHQGGADYVITGQRYDGHAWRDASVAHFVETTSEELIAAGMLKPKRTCP